MKKEQEVILILFKDFLMPYNSRSISKIVHLSHAGAFKILKRLEKREIVKPQRIGKAVIYTLNADSPLALKEIEMSLFIESQNYRRWIEEFTDLEDKAEFVVLFGSILKKEKDARDIDLLIVAEKHDFQRIKHVINKRNQFLSKKVHLLLQTPEDFKDDIKNKNKIMINIIKTGIVLFGHQEIIKALKSQ